MLDPLILSVGPLLTDGELETPEARGLASAFRERVRRHSLHVRHGLDLIDERRRNLLAAAVAPLQARAKDVNREAPDGARQARLSFAVHRPLESSLAPLLEEVESFRLRRLDALKAAAEAWDERALGLLVERSWNLDLAEPFQPLRLLRAIQVAKELLKGRSTPSAPMDLISELGELSEGVGDPERERERIAVVGEAPSRRYGPFAGPWYSRLAELAGVGQVPGLLLRFDLHNLLERPQPRSGKGAHFPETVAATQARKMRKRLSGRKVILLGRRVAKAWGLGKAEYLRWMTIAEPGAKGLARNVGRVAVFPHPSGVDRWWNDEGSIERARGFMHAAVEGR